MAISIKDIEKRVKEEATGEAPRPRDLFLRMVRWVAQLKAVERNGGFIVRRTVLPMPRFLELDIRPVLTHR
jgi:hypothetical protein